MLDKKLKAHWDEALRGEGLSPDAGSWPHVIYVGNSNDLTNMQAFIMKDQMDVQDSVHKGRVTRPKGSGPDPSESADQNEE